MIASVFKPASVLAAGASRATAGFSGRNYTTSFSSDYIYAFKCLPLRSPAAQPMSVRTGTPSNTYSCFAKQKKATSTKIICEVKFKKLVIRGDIF